MNKNGGKNPKWEGQTFEINVHSFGENLNFKVYDKETFSTRFIGSGESKLAALASEEGKDAWFDLAYKGKPAGKLHFRC